MRVAVELNTPEVVSTTAAHLVLRDPDSGLPVAEIAIRGAGYVVLDAFEREEIAINILEALQMPRGDTGSGGSLEIPDREGGYHGEPRLWEQVAAEQAEKRASYKSSGKVVKLGGKKVNVPTSLEEINYPEGCEFLPLTPEEAASGQTLGIVRVPSRKGETADGKKFRRACKRARAQQLAFLEAQKSPELVEEGEVEESEEAED